MNIISRAKKIAKTCLSFLWQGYSIKKKITGFENKIIIKSICVGVTIDIVGSNNSLTILEGGFIEGLNIFVRGSNISIFIEENVSFHRGGASLWLEDDGSKILIGSNSSFFGDVHIASTEGASISIGSECLIAPAVQIRNGDSHAIYYNGVRSNLAKSVVISDRVWIGDGAVILKGSSIPPNSVVATKSVVTKSFHEPGSVVAGNPAHQVKTGITWSVDRRSKDKN